MPYVEVDMEMSKKTTILFPPVLHKQLMKLARSRGVSLGQLVRDACESEYGKADEDSRMAAVEGLRKLALPVGSPRSMKRESVIRPEDIGT